MKSISLSVLLLLAISFSAFANRIEVSDHWDIDNVWSPGDTLVMLDGYWTDQTIKIRGEGTAEEPIVLMPETLGGVILDGRSRIKIFGKYIIVRDLYFKDGNLSGDPVVEFRTSSDDLAENCRLTNTVIENYNPPANTTDSKWVSIYGKNNRVDHCTFVNKTNSGTLLVVWLKSGIEAHHQIDHNFFGYRDPNLDSSGKELNGQEIIRIGDSSTSMTEAFVNVTDNYFEYCNGEIEIISNKSCQNVYTNNVFNQCVGMLTLRHGNACTVDGNYFFGNGLDNTGGVRVIGEDHKVYNNYFDNLRGTGFRAGLCLVRGQEDSELNEYFQVKNAQVAFNTFVDCSQSFSVNYNSSSSRIMPPIGTYIAHNHVYNTSSRKNVTIYQTNVEAMDVTWKNNLMNQGTFTSFDYTETEVITGVEPSMLSIETAIPIMEPAESSLLAGYQTDEFADVTTDLRARTRGTMKTPGASELTGTPTREMPTRENSGANFVDPSTSVDKKLATTETLDAWMDHGLLVTEVTEAGWLDIYDISGRCLHQKRLEPGINYSELVSAGIMILRFRSESNTILTRKIALIN